MKHVAAWVDSNGRDQLEFNCTCSKEGNCHHSVVQNFCNCDATPSVSDWLEDTGIITNRSLLPITEFTYGFLRGMANVTIGALRCKGGHLTPDVE